MTSERMQRRLDAFLDEADAAATRRDWDEVAEKARAVLALEPNNADAAAFLKMAHANLDPAPHPATAAAPPSASVEPPSSFAAGRYQVRRFLGEGGKKRVYLTHDERLDRDVAFALIKTDGLDDVGRERIVREAQAMGRLGAHPHIVTIFEIGEEAGAPYVVTELMAGGDVEGELERVGGPLAVERAIGIASGVARGLAFAHDRGIVHRDLKPGNVWLTAEGVPKIGDFGLAVTAGRSRLTQHGMMVGTFAYMPPEQALGGSATPQSDLYSLGCMLYELVTGKPPFEGDTPIAVISQHLNNTPVAPSWHTEHCPPALEDLILSLLGKDPAARPASASAVLAILEGIDPAKRSRSHSDSQANPLERLARGVFVGRGRELERLRSALDGALSGRGSVVMLVGEPGIGKTRTVKELETYARMRGAKVLWGRAHESSGAPPYWPWVQVGRAYRDDTPEDVRRRQYQPYAVELQRIFPGLRDLFPNLPDPPAETEEGQFRLFDAFAAFAGSVSQETPLLIVLDDLHWADRATLQLLTHLAREIGRDRILLVGTYRDTDLDRRHPLAGALAELNREDLFVRLPLRGLNLDETTDYVRRTAHLEPSRELVTSIYEETEGNPFFMAEIVNLMTQEGTLDASVSDVRIPEGVKEALGRRLDRLSDEANALLTTLAVAGREFDHALVRELSEHEDGATLGLLEEGLRARVLEETAAGRYRFTHALMQETLLEELSAARRVLLHGRIAEVLERLYGESRDYLAAIAEHYRESALLNAGHAPQAVRSLERAAAVEAGAFAWDKAAMHLDQCLAIATDHGVAVDDAELLRRRGEARVAAGALRDGWGDLTAAAERFRARHDWRQQARSALAASLVYGRVGAQDGVLTAAIEAPGEANPNELALLHARRARLRGAEGASDADQARALLAGRPDPVVEAELLAYQASELMRLGEFTQAAPLFAAAVRLFDAQALHASAIAVMANEHDCYLLSGDYAAAMREYDVAIAYARAKRQPIQEHVWLGDSGALATLTGDFELARRRLEEGSPPRVYLYHVNRVALAEATGELAAIEDELPDPRSVGGVAAMVESIHALRARAHYLAGDLDHARVELDAALDPSLESVAERRMSHSFGSFDTVLAAVGTDEQVRAMYERLLRSPTVQMVVWCSTDRMRGELALRLGLLDAAGEHLRTALAWSEREQCSLEAGRCYQALAQLAEAMGDPESARRHLDAAGELFARHGAKLYLDQVIAKKQFLKA